MHLLLVWSAPYFVPSRNGGFLVSYEKLSKINKNYQREFSQHSVSHNSIIFSRPTLYNVQCLYENFCQSSPECPCPCPSIQAGPCQGSEKRKQRGNSQHVAAAPAVSLPASIKVTWSEEGNSTTTTHGLLNNDPSPGVTISWWCKVQQKKGRASYVQWIPYSQVLLQQQQDVNSSNNLCNSDKLPLSLATRATAAAMAVTLPPVDNAASCFRNSFMTAAAAAAA